MLRTLDNWMAAHPWHPRLAPFAAYIVLLAAIGSATQWRPWTLVPLYVVQCALACWLMWRYRGLVRELTVSFHWLAIPVGVGVFGAWVALGWLMAGEFGLRWHAIWQGRPIALLDYDALGVARPRFATSASDGPFDFRDPAMLGEQLGVVMLGLRLLGMSIVVPLLEELFIRSLMLRSLHSAKATWVGLLQVAADMPVIGDWVMQTRAGGRAADAPPVWGRQLLQTPLGALSVFGVAASTLVFMVSHLPRDWPGIWVCGVAYCLLLSATRRKGLGPVVWAHGITNALLWAYTLSTGDWQFM